jgi:diguanylate cyclase (GGDEF)-like protein
MVKGGLPSDIERARLLSQQSLPPSNRATTTLRTRRLPPAAAPVTDTSVPAPGGSMPDPGRNPASSPERAEILLLDHHGDRLGDIHDALRAAGYHVVATQSIAETWQLSSRHGADWRPSLIVLSALVLQPGSLEQEFVATLQAQDPLPVLLVIDGVRQLQDARRVELPLKDFLIRPCTPEEAVGRIEQALALRERFRALQNRARDLEGQVSIDFKTGLLTDRHFQNVLNVEWKRAQRHHSPLALLWMDVDDFKSVNDSTDYAFGDLVLAGVAAALRGSIRETDFAARFGGDEFLVLLPQTSPAEAVQTALRIRRILGAKVFANESFQRRVTLSIGIDTFDGRAAMTPDVLRRHANEALKEAKQRGKNRVWLYTEKGGALGAGAAELGG